MEDITPPAVPTKLSGSMTKNGVAQLKWSANAEKDLKGYRVFKSNKPTDEFVEITRSILSDPSYSDTINTNVLNKKVYYKVVAVDKSFNVSEYTPYLVMTKPDVVAPAPPLFTKTEIVDGKINLEWENSVSDDVARYVLLRRSKLDTTSVKILEWQASDNRKKMEDNSVVSGQLYRYTLSAFDSADNKGSTVSRDIFYETGIRNAVTALKATADRESKVITLQWQNGSKADRVFVYRKKNDEPFILYQSLEGNVESFKDTGRNIPINNVYVYKLQLSFKDGIKSMISSEAKVKF
jgi:uncharacterized protein